MNRAKWIWAAAATGAIVAALGAGLRSERDPIIREGWQAASCAAAIAATLALIATTIVWDPNSKGSPSAPPETDGNSGIANKVNGTAFEGSMVQGRNVHMDNASYSGDHMEFRDVIFHDSVTGKQTNTSCPGAGANHWRERNR